MMSVIYKQNSSDEYIQFTKGASEKVIEYCDNVGIGAHQQQMTDEKKKDILDMMDFLAEQGLRVLAIACKSSNEEAVKASNADQPEGLSDDEKTKLGEDREAFRPSQIECNLTLLGLAGLYDPPRDETTDAVRGEFQMPSGTMRFSANIFSQLVLARASKSTCSLATTRPLLLPSQKMLVSSLATRVPP
jgi:magnesium-transporting ATPase (P-type)